MPVRVMSYNVRYFGHALPLRGASSSKRAISSIARAIATLSSQPDVVCLQEVEHRSLRSYLSLEKAQPGDTQLQALMRTLDSEIRQNKRKHQYRPLYFPAHEYAIGSAKIYTTGLSMLIRDDVEVLSHNADAPTDITHRRPTRWIRDLKQSRVCAHARVRDRRGQAIDIFNTHMSLPAFVSKEFFAGGARMGRGQNQEAEVDALTTFIHNQADNDRFVLVGDFNSEPHTPAYDRLVQKLGVVDPFPEVVGHHHGGLWPTAGFMHLRMRLDHMFLGSGLRCLDFEDSHRFGERDGRWDGLSDHVPLLSRVRVR